MKMLSFLIFVHPERVRGNVIVQNQEVYVDLKNSNKEEFLREIKNQTRIRFMYKSEYVRDIPRFNMHAEGRGDGFAG